MWLSSPRNVIANLIDAFEQALKLAAYAHQWDNDAEAIRDAFNLAQTIVGEISVEMRVQGTSIRAAELNTVATLQARLDAAEALTLMPPS